MSRKTLYILLSTLVLLAGISFFTGQQESDESKQSPMLPGLSELVEPGSRINEITVTTAGENVVARLSKMNDTWVELGSGYPANTMLIESILKQLAAGKNIAEKTTRADQYSRLGLQDILQQDARGIELQLSMSPASSPNADEFSAAIILGDKTNGGQYVRVKGEAQSWLSDISLEIPDDNVEWLNRELLDIAAAQLVAITIIHPNQTRLELIKPDSDKSEFQLKYPATADDIDLNPNKIAGILSGLRFESVQPAVAGANPPAEVTIGEFVTSDGMLITSNSWRNKEGHFFSFIVSAATDMADIDEIAKLQQKLSGWIYTLPGYKAEQFLTTTSDLLK